MRLRARFAFGFIENVMAYPGVTLLNFKLFVMPYL